MKRIFFILIVGMFLSGCINEEYISVPEGKSITFTLVSSAKDKTTSNSLQTRAEGVDDYNENKIDRLDIFFFNELDMCLYYPPTLTSPGNTITVSISDEISSILYNRDITLYILANCSIPRETLVGKTLTEIRNMTQTNKVTFNYGNRDIQENFLMDGSITTFITGEGVTQLREVSLRRAAAKIVVKINNAEIEGYTAENAEVRITNYLDITNIGDGVPFYNAQANEYKTSSYRSLYIPKDGVDYSETVPFYSYVNDWEFDISKETFITIAVDWRNTEGTTKRYYYRLPLNYIPTDNEDNFNYRLRRNHIYEFGVNIGSLGGPDPEDMVELTPNFTLKEWTDETIEVELTQYDYLFVKERNIIINDRSNYSIQYNSSRPIQITDINAYHQKDLYDGEIDTVTYEQGHPNFPQFTIDNSNSYIHMISPVPTNYVPVYISFTVKNEAGLTQKVNIIQYPRIYVTSSYSPGPVGAWNGISHNPDMTNYNFYTVTIKSIDPSDGFMLSGDLVTYDYDGEVGETIPKTKTDDESNNMVSPKFVIASQRGVTSNWTTYSTAQRRCGTYYESQYPTHRWRIPTQAEMLLIAKLQRDPNSALKSLFTPEGNSDKWWTARYKYIKGDGSYWWSVRMAEEDESKVLHPQWFINGKNEAGGTSYPSNSVRCVYDVWKYE